MAQPDYISVSDAALITGLTVRGIRQKIERGQIPGVTSIRTGSRQLWLVPRIWALSYQRPADGRGRPKKQQQTQ